MITEFLEGAHDHTRPEILAANPDLPDRINTAMEAWPHETPFRFAITCSEATKTVAAEGMDADLRMQLRDQFAFELIPVVCPDEAHAPRWAEFKFSPSCADGRLQ